MFEKIRRLTNLTCNATGSAAHDCTLCTRRPASVRGFAAWMTPAVVDVGPNAGAGVSGRNFYHFCALYLLQLYVFYQLFTPEQPFSAH